MQLNIQQRAHTENMEKKVIYARFTYKTDVGPISSSISARYWHPKSARRRMCNPAQVGPISDADIGLQTYSRFSTYIHNKLFSFLQHICLLSLTYNRTYIYFAKPFIRSAKLNIHIHNILKHTYFNI
jgi:hypothetical protein